MLNPFRIRNLYFDSTATDLIDLSGVVQLSAQQYDQEIQAFPETALAYLDEDDGETVTVGSSLELEQRLSEPPGRYSSWTTHLTTDDSPPLHVFDIRPSTRAAEAWRKYVIGYSQPDASNPVQESSPKPEKSKPDDYQSLLVRLQVLELEVKLLKEALKTHAITDPLQPQLPQQPVFVRAYKNSDLPKQPSIPAMHQTPFVPNRRPQTEETKQCLGLFGEQGCHNPNIDPSKRDSFDVLAVCPVEPIDQISFKARLNNESVESPLPGYTIPGNMFDSAMQGNLPHLPQMVQHSVSREPKNDAESSPETFPGGPTNFKKSEGQTQHPLHDVINPGLHVDQKLSIMAQQAQIMKVAPAAVPFPYVAISHNASKSLLDLEPEAEIARFPTIFQLEKEDLRSVQTKSSNVTDVCQSTIPLARANTVTCSNPAARLLKPFDPIREEFGVSKNLLHSTHHNDTERSRRLPRADASTGSVARTPWEQTKRSEHQAEITVPTRFSRPEPQSLDSIHALPLPLRTQSLNHDRPSNNSPSDRLLAMRSAVDPPRTQNNQQIPTTANHLRRPLPPTFSTPNVFSHPRADPDHKRAKRISSCIRSLQDMGYKPPSRLPIYAEACDGDICKAMTMAEEDEKATQETRKTSEMDMKVLTCMAQLKAMGYSVQFHDDQLRKFAKNVGGDVALAVESIEAPTSREMEQWRERLRVGRASAGGMPGSFP